MPSIPSVCEITDDLCVFSASDHRERRRTVDPRQWEDGEAQAAGGRGRLGAELHWSHAGYSFSNNPNVMLNNVQKV